MTIFKSIKPINKTIMNDKEFDDAVSEKLAKLTNPEDQAFVFPVITSFFTAIEETTLREPPRYMRNTVLEALSRKVKMTNRGKLMEEDEWLACVCARYLPTIIPSPISLITV